MKPPIQGILILLALITAQLHAQTTITSDRLSVENKEEYNLFNFSKSVQVKGDDINITCDDLEITAQKSSSGKDKINDMGSIEKIVALGHVNMTQEGKKITAGRAEIFPQEGKVVLEDNPRVEDEQGVVTGYRMTLYQGSHTAHVEGSPDGERPSVLLPNLPELGLGKSKQKANSSENKIAKES